MWQHCYTERSVFVQSKVDRTRIHMRLRNSWKHGEMSCRGVSVLSLNTFWSLNHLWLFAHIEVSFRSPVISQYLLEKRSIIGSQIFEFLRLHIKKKKGKGKTIRTPENIQKVKKSFWKSPTRSIMKRSSALQLTTTVRRIVKKDLKLHAYKIVVAQELKPQDHDARTLFAQTLLNKLKSKENPLNKLNRFMQKGTLYGHYLSEKTASYVFVSCKKRSNWVPFCTNGGKHSPGLKFTHTASHLFSSITSSPQHCIIFILFSTYSVVLWHLLYMCWFFSHSINLLNGWKWESG